MDSHGLLKRFARFGRDLLHSDPGARKHVHAVRILDPLEKRFLLAGIPVAPQASQLLNNVNTIGNNLNNLGNDNTTLPLAKKSLRQLNQASNPVTPVGNPLSNALNDPTASNGKEQLRDAIFSQMHAYMADRTGDSAVTRDDVSIPTYDDTTATYKVVLTLDYTNPTFPLPLNTGLPALPFNITSGQVLVSTGFHYTDFSWGLNNGTYYFDTTPTDELTVRTNITLDRSVPIQGSMGFLQITATDSVNAPAAPGTTLSGSTLIDMQTSGSLPVPANPRFSGNAHIGLNISTLNTAPIDGKPSPPDTRFGFRTDWGFVNQSPSTSFANWGSPPNVYFDNVEINLGGFLNRVMQPILTDVQKITRQFQPVFDVLKERIPILSDLSNLVGGDDINLIKLNHIIDQTGIIPQGIQNLLNLTLQVAQTGDALNQLKIGPGAPVINDAWMPFGSFDLSTNAPLQSLPPAIISQTVANWTSLATHSNTTINLAFIENWIHTNVAAPFGDQVVNLIEVLNGDTSQDGAWIKYPILDNPQQGIDKLLLGQQTDLVTATFRLQNTPLDLNFNIPTPIPVLDVRLNANITPDIFIQGGYDTTGLREYVASASPSFSMFRDGLWINTSTHARMEGFVGVGPQTTGSVIEPFVLGGVSANFRADPLTGLVLPDPTRAHVFVDLLDKPYLATVTGNVDVSLRFGVKIGIDFPWPVGFVGIEPSFDLGLYHLFDYYQGVPNPFYFPPSPIATLDPNTHILTLNMGSQALRDARGIQTNEINENFHISALTDQVANAGGGQDLLVTAFGVSGSYANVAGIIADGDDGNDVIVITADVSVPATIHGGAGDDQISYLGSGDVSITGDAGNDQIIGGSGNTTILGGDGNDNITGGSGVGVTNILDGGNDDDRLLSGPGSATLIGGPGNDQLVGNLADDTLDGGDGNDSLLGSGGNDSISAGIGDDQIDAGIGNDTISAGAGNDQVLAGDGNDSITGEDGIDTIIGGLGADFIDGGNHGDILIAANQDSNTDNASNTIYGGSGNDSIAGSSMDDLIDAGSGDDGVLAYAGKDTVYGGAGFDSIYGSDGNDVLFGQDDADQLYGEAGSDSLYGGTGDDTILGSDGNDQITGDDGADSIIGGANDDSITGGIGNDTIYGSDGTDRIFGDDGADSLLGENDNDYIEGGAGDDTIQGNDGLDTILGQDNNDSINAGNQNDLVYGGLGNDQILGREGNDTIYGGAGDDTISGFDGIDWIRGDSGNDSITGGNDIDFIRGGSGNDTIDAGAANDVVCGEEGDDSISGNTGADRIDAGAGNDTVYGFAATGTDDNTGDTILGRDGSDQLIGGGGADWIDGGASADTLAGNDGNDTLLAGSGVGDSIVGGTGNDRIIGSDDGSDSDPNFADTTYFGDIIDGSSGNDTISGLGGADLIFGGSNNDSIDSGAGGDSVAGGAGDDFLYSGQNGATGDRIDGAAGSDTIHGSDANDTLSGSDDNDQIFGHGGADSITGDLGDDVIDSGAGDNDFASGGDGNDQITDSGGANNTLSGDNGNDTLTGSNDGSDSISGGSGRDRISGRAGNDTITGGSEVDTLYGNAGDDLISGDAGADIALGGQNHDTIYGQNAADSGEDNAVDTLYGDLGTNGNEAGSGRDILFGQGGNDLLYGEGDLDSIVGGAGANNLVSYGPGGSTTPEAYSAPSPTAPPAIQPFVPFTLAGGTLPSGADYRGQWTELASSASNGGISTSGGNALDPSIAIGADGAKYVAWVDGRRGNYEVYVAKYTTGSGWQQLAGSASEGGVSNTLTSSRRPSITIAGDGNPIVAWSEITPTGSDIRLAKFDGSNWVALGSSLSAGGLSNTGSADRPVVMTTSSGTVVAWVNTNVAVANAYARLFTGGSWQEFGAIGSGSGNGISNNPAGIADLSAATDGTKVSVTWSALDASGVKQIYLREFSAGAWSGLGSSFGASGLSNTAGDSESPTVAYYGGQRFVSWVDNTGGANEIYSATFTGGTWAPAGGSINTSNTGGDATSPHLASSSGGMTVTWSDDRSANAAGNGISIYSLKWNGTAYVPDVASDNTGTGVQQTRGVADVAVAASPSGRPTIAWSDATPNGKQVLLRANDSVVSRIFNAGGATSVQSILDGNTLGAGDIIVVSGSSTGFTVSAADAGVQIVGLTGASISGAVTINAANVTLQALSISGTVAINAASCTIRESTLPAVQVNGVADAQIVHCTTGLLTISGGATNCIIEHNTLNGVTIGGGGATGLSLRDNTITATVSLANTASGAIAQNHINAAGTGLNIAAAFTGTISDNDITGTTTGVSYGAAASLSGNRIFGSGTGVNVTVAGSSGFGFVGVTSPNQIYNNTTGVVLAGGSMQNQHIYSNTTGVSGTGILGGGSLDLANLIELNTTGVTMTGPVMYNKIARNTTGIAASNGQLIAHNIIWNNTLYGLRSSGRSDVRVFNNSFYTNIGDNVRVASGNQDIQLINNILFTEGGYNINVDDDSRGGFFSDFNDLHSAGTGILIHWLKDFNDILDWQMDVNDSDLHSVGRTIVNPDRSDPGFSNKSWDDFHVYGLAGGQRGSNVTIDAGTPLADQGVDVSRTNLLTNPSFESGVGGWLVSAGGTTQSASPNPFDGTKYFYPGNIAVGSAEQTIDLLAAGYTAGQLDSQDYVLTFGGRIRSAGQKVQLVLTFLDGSSSAIGSPVTVQARNVNDRWELVGDRRVVPVGARFVKYRFESTLQSGSANTSYLDAAFAYVESENNAPDLGAYGNSSTDAAQIQPPHIALRSPDLYTDLILAQPIDIRWDSFGNTSDSPVRIDLYQDTPDGPAFLLNITTGTADTGHYTWIPQSSGLTAGTSGLRIQLSYSADNITLDRAAEASTVPQAGSSYYIDDGSDTNDDYTPGAVGSNRNTGKLPTAPKPLLTTLTRVYDLNPSDTVYVDTGTYQHFKTLTLSGAAGVGDDEGATFTGPTNPAHVAQILPFGFTAGALIDLNQGDFTTLTHLSLGGGTQFGIWVRNGSTNNNITYVTQTGASLDGIRVDSTSFPITLNHLDVSSNGQNGVWVEGPWSGMTDSKVYGNVQAGIRASNTQGGATFEANEVYNNGTGISVYNNGASPAIIGNANLSLGRGNKVYNNSVFGIEANTNVQVIGNSVSGTPGANHAAIRAYNAVTVTKNVVFNSNIGIWGGTITGNRVYGNTIGIYQGDQSNESPGPVTQNVIYSNGVGYRDDRAPNVASSAQPIFINNLVYANSTIGVLVNGGSSGTIYNNTIYQTAGDAIQVNVNVSTYNVQIRNNILHVDGASGYALDIATGSQPGVSSDYNLFYLSGSAKAGFWSGAARNTLIDWRTISGQDNNSLSADPLYVDMDGADNKLGVVGGVDYGADDNFHVNSPTGSFKGNGFAPILSGAGIPMDPPAGSFTADAGSYSPAIDRGDDSIPLTNEPSPNGTFTNLGAFGNTTQASMSPSQYALVLLPNGSENWVEGQTFPIKWRQETIPTGTVLIELLHKTGPSSYTLESTLAASAPNNGTFNWLIPTSGIPAGNDYVIRVTRNGTPSINDVSDNPFTISPPTPYYYVNDGTVSPGDWTTAPGNDANDGLTPATPKATIQGLLNAYDFGPGDIIRVDRGYYALANNIVITNQDAGVTIVGFTGTSNSAQWSTSVLGDAPTHYYRFGDASGTTATDSSGNGRDATYVNGVTLGAAGALDQDSNSAASFDGVNDYVSLPSGFQSFPNGFSFETWVKPTAVGSWQRMFDIGNGASSNNIIFYRNNNSNTLSFSVFNGATQGAVVSAPNALITNQWQHIAVTMSAAGAVSIYRNGLLVGSGNTTVPNNVVRTSNYIGRSNFPNDSYFAGSMDETAFYDKVLTPAQIAARYELARAEAVIDRANTSSGAVDFELQNADNITIQNLKITGGYNAVLASSSSDSDGVTLSGNDMYNAAWYTMDIGTTNDNWLVTGNTVRNGGNRGIVFSGSGSTLSGNQVFANGYNGIEISNANTVTGNTVYGSLSGSGIVASYNTNSGPRLIVQNNTVYNNAWKGIEGYGGWVTIQGNEVYGQALSPIDFYSGIYSSQGQVLNNIVHDNGVGISGTQATFKGNRVYHNNGNGINVGASVVQGNIAYNNGTWGISNYGAYYQGSTVSGNLVYSNGSGGIVIDGNSDTNITNNTIYQPAAGDGLNMAGNPSTRIGISNNIIVVGNGIGLNFGAGAHTVLTSDYNLVRITGSGSYGRLGGTTYATRDAFYFDTGYDQHSLTVDPQFTDPDGADNLLGYTSGADHGLDDDFSLATTSPAIDAGDPSNYFYLEPQPNGARINLGHQGNTPQATVSGARSIHVIMPNGLDKLTVGTPYTIGFATTGISQSVPILFMNAGGNATGSWSSQSFVTGGLWQNLSVPNAIITTGVTNPAPQAVYQSYARSNYADTLLYSLPLPDGNYTIRLHFMDPDATAAGQRLMDVKINGTTLNTNYDIFAAAGARYKATTLTYSATASGGNGVTVGLTGKSNYAILSGIEVTAAVPSGLPNPKANVEVSLNNGGTWSPVASNVPINSLGFGSFTWTPDTPSNQALIRVTDANSPASDVSDSPFVIGDSGTDYYINDGSTAGDVFTTAIGDDNNSGKSPSTPMRSLAALLAAYDLGPGDVVHVDTGNYTVTSTISLQTDDSGVSIVGPGTSGSATAIFTRSANTSAVLVFNGASNVTLSRLGFTGGSYGIYSYTDGNNSSPVSTNLTITNCEIFGNTSGLGLFNQGSGSVLSNNLIRNNSSTGMDVETFYGSTVYTMTATGNEIRNNGQGSTFRVSGGTFANNLIYGNGSSNSRSVQIYTNGGVNDTISVTGNTIRNNTAGLALSIGGNVIADGNFIYDNSGTGVEQGANFRNNSVYHNGADGILAGGLTTTDNNRVFGNAGIGINLTDGATARGNVVYSNNRGLSASYYYNGGTITNNLVYGNTVYGMAINGAGGGFAGIVKVQNNTIYQPLGDGVQFNSNVAVNFSSNIIVVGTGYAESLSNSNSFGLSIDYNTVQLQGSAKFGKYDAVDFPTRADWVYEFGWDRHSLSADPQFVDPDGADNLLGYSGGVDHGADDNFAVLAGSPTIDAGDPLLPYYSEPSPNGGRVNQGHTGNTAAAQTSTAGGIVQVLSPSGLEKQERDAALTITWRTANLLGPNPDSAYASAIQALNPALYLRLNESSGATAADSSGNARNGTYQNGALLNQPGVWGASADSAVSFDGVDDAVFDSSAALNLTSQVTFAAWINPAALDHTWMPIIVKGDGQYYSRTYSLWLNQNGSLTFDTSDQSGSERSIATATGLVPAGQWTHVAASMDKTTGAVLIYVNGQLITTGTVPITPARSGSQPLSIGYSTEDPNYRFHGSIDEVAVFSSVLTPQQIGQIYGSDKGTVNLALVNGSGTVVSAIATNVPNTGSYNWTIPAGVPEGSYRVRVTSNLGSNPWGQSDSLFSIVNAGHDYYVNDLNSTNDAFTTALGNNANTGKSPSQPMRDLAALLNMYDLDAGDVVHVDSGTYVLPFNTRLTTNDSGVRIEGPQSGAGQAIFDRNIVADANYAAFEMVGGDNITLDHLVIRKGGYGVVAWSGNDSDGITISNSDISGQYDYGIYDYDSNDNWTITGNTVHDNTSTFGQGIIVDRVKGVTVTNNTVSNVTRIGINVTLSDAASLVQGNTVFGAATGIVADATPNASGGTIRVLNNTVHDCPTGIVLDQSGGAYSAYGSGNVLYLNGTGMVVNFGSLAENNRVFANTSVGIVGNDNGTIRNNQIYSNATGVSLGRDRGFSGYLLSNIIYANTTRGVLVNNSSGARLFNNTIYSIVGDAIRLQGSPNVNISNNILWTNAGSSIFVADGTSQSGLLSDRNIFNGTGSVGSWNGATQSTLAAWQSASAKDGSSLFADPLFVDLDGADNVLGYRTLPTPFDGGTDDNFFVAKNSPAIDHGSSANAALADFYGGGRVDDPGTPNTGTNFLYTPTVTGSNLFSATGTSQNFRTYNNNFLLNLPFTFNFYGVDYTSVRVGANGILQFGGGTQLTNDSANSTAKFITQPAIAPLWDDLYTYGSVDDNVFVDTSVPNQVKVRWNASFNVSGAPDVQFDVVLFSDGSFRFDYGPGNTGLSPTVGISAGNGVAYQVYSYDGLASLSNANTLTVGVSTGITDIGAIEFRGTSADVTPPALTTTTPPAIGSGGTLISSPASIVLNFSEPLNRIDAAAIANYDLRSAGPDNTFDTGDDILFTLTPQYIDGSTQVTLLYSPGTMPDGLYRLTVRSNSADNSGIHDRAGLLLDGDGNASAGGNFIRTFTVAKDVGAPTVLNSSFNVDAAPSSITIQFSEDVSASLTTADLVLQNLTTHTTIPSGNLSLSWSAGNTLTIHFAGYTGGILPDGNYRLTVIAAGVTDGVGNPLAADHTLDFFCLAGDANGDRIVDLRDLYILSSNYKMTGRVFSQGDFNYDGTVDAKDTGILSRNWQKQLSSDVTPPTVTNASFNYLTSPNTLVFTFSEDVSASLGIGSLVVTAQPGGAPVAVTGYSYNAATNTATYTLAANLPDGNYRATFAAGSFSDSSGNALAATYNYDFFFLAGDVNHDRIVDGLDTYIVNANWHQSPRDYSQGDVNYDGTVDDLDLTIISMNWQKTLPPGGSPSQPLSAPPPSTTPARTPTRTATRVIRLIE